MTYDENVNTVFERIMDMRENSLAELINAERYYTYIPGRVDMIFCEQDLFMSVVPCHGKVILTRDRYLPDLKKYVAEYAIYSATGKDSFNEPLDPNAEVIFSEAVYKFDYVCDKTFDNRALAIANAVKEIYKEDSDHE